MKLIDFEPVRKRDPSLAHQQGIAAGAADFHGNQAIVAHSLRRQVEGADAGGPLDAAFPIPADASLFGAQTFAQGLLGDLSGGASQATFLTDALRLCIGG